MEALETAIAYWYEVLERYRQREEGEERDGGGGSGQALAVTSEEEAEFTAKLQELLEDAYRLQVQGDQLFHNEVRR